MAISIVEGIPEGGGELAQPLPDVAEIDGWVYSSLPLEIEADGAAMRVTRLRQVVSPAGELTERVDETHLAVLDAATLEAEAREAGLRPAGRREVPSTPDHVGSVVVILEARMTVELRLLDPLSGADEHLCRPGQHPVPARGAASGEASRSAEARPVRASGSTPGRTT